MSYSNNESLIEDLKDDAQDIAGASAGALIGFAIGGAPGALVSSIMPVLVDAAQRLHGRKRKKFAALAVYSITKIQYRLDAGDIPRNDGFFERKTQRPSSAEELWEGAVAAAEDENEQRKLKYIASLAANICFNKAVNPSSSIKLLRFAHELTYTQLLLLRVFSDETIKCSLRQKNYRGGKSNLSSDQVALLTEVYDLHRLGLVIIPNDTILGISDADPGHTHLQGLGKTLYELMELNETPMKDIREIVVQLS